MKRKILVVDDQEVNRLILSEILKDDYDILEAEDGVKALEIIGALKNDLSAVILDIVMPNKDGFEVLKEIRKDQTLASLPVIVATQHEGEESELKSLTMGASDFISKPYNAKIIIHRLKNLIKLREATITIGLVEMDMLTGILNREGFFNKVSEALKSDPEGEYDLVALNIERFKIINDAYGDAEGDNLLIEIAWILNGIAAETGAIVGRMQADQFMFMLRRDKGRLSEIIDDICDKMSDYPIPMKIEVKFGIYEISDDKMSVNQMCDRAWLAAKEVTGIVNETYLVYRESMHDKIVKEQNILNEMSRSLVDGHFHVYLQGKYEVATGRIAGAEALIRWIHPEFGFMTPGDFIPVFEKNGFISHIDMFVWDRVCELIAEWKDRFDKLIPVSVNVSRKDLYNENLPQILMYTLDKHGIEPQWIHLEITETAYTDDSEQLIEMVSTLKDMGFIFEMDDFGSGYSSLNMLSDMPVDILKLDMKFIQNSQQNDNGMKIIQFVIMLAKWLNLPVVAEGVETEEQLNFLKTIGCTYAQGYYYSKPLPVDEFVNIFTNGEIVDPDDEMMKLG